MKARAADEVPVGAVVVRDGKNYLARIQSGRAAQRRDSSCRNARINSSRGPPSAIGA